MTKIFPKISIVTPSFNQAQFIESTIQSVLSQNYPNLEYIIIDGGSTDGSVEIIRRYEEHLHFWCSESDRGQYDAINKGFERSTGEIMAWINSDDMYLPWALTTIADIMISLSQVEWLTTLSPCVWDYSGFCSGFSSISGYAIEAFMDGCYLPFDKLRCLGWIQQESTFWRRELWQRSGGSLGTDMKVASDFDLWSRFYLYADLYGTPSPLSGFRKQSHQRSRNIEAYDRESKLSLLTMRETLHWRPNPFRDFLLTAKVRNIPKVRSYMISRWGYAGKKIIREKSDCPDGYWKVEDYRF
jgi:glycosyltransferase involved in cell wall biosynthesis